MNTDSSSIREASRRMPVEFTGRGGEYFRIWIVHLVLTILTLGIYSAWLHRRNDTMGLKPTTLLCKRGTVLIWHANLMHMSMDPKPGTTRASQVTHYYFKKEGIKYTVPAFDMEKTDTFALEQKRFAVSKDGPI